MKYGYLIGLGLFSAFSIYRIDLILSNTAAGDDKSRREAHLRSYVESTSTNSIQGTFRQNTNLPVLPVSPSSEDPDFEPPLPTHVIHWSTREDLKAFMQAYFRVGNLVCENAPASTTEAEHTLLNISFGCNDLFTKSALGTGNYVAAFYAARLAAKVTGMDLAIHCADALEERANLILPWLTGYFPAPSPLLKRQWHEWLGPRVEDVCRTIDDCPIGYMHEEMQFELRRMALAMVGFPPASHSTYDKILTWVAEERSSPRQHRLELPFSDPTTPTLYPSTDLDDVIIHFRCGDLMSSNHPRFGFLKFSALAQHVSPAASTIGIVTQPFDDSGQSRAWDNSPTKRDRCRIVVGDFVAYLQELFPRARVRVHNKADETIALTYARMIMANQSIAGISTFGVFPSIASFGTGYIRLPDNQSATNKWLTNPRLDSIMPNLVLMDEPNILMVRQVQKLWEEDDGQDKILNWFRDSSISY